MVFFLIAPSIVAAPGFTASLDRSAISLGESATLSLIFTDVSMDSPPNLPRIPNLEINHAGQSSQFNFVNGSRSTIVTHNYAVTPATVGEFTIPALRLNAGATVLASQPVQLKVVQGQVPAAPGEKPSAFLKIIVPKNEVYLGEPFVVELQLYCHEARLTAAPQLESDGFTVGTVPQPIQTRAQVGSEIYNLVIFKMPLTPAKVGSIPLGPATLGLNILTGSDIFGFGQTRSLTLRSEPQIMQVLPLPAENRPPDFNGAIGKFSMTFDASPTNLAVGDPITLKVKISGSGSLDSLSLPALKEWRDFKVYPATSKIELKDPLGLTGTKTFEEVVVPENSAVRELPPLYFSFFDPEMKNYRTLTNPPTPLIVRPGAATPQPTVFANPAETVEQKPSRDIVHIKAQLGALEVMTAPLHRQPWFLACQGVPPLVWIASLILRKRQEQWENNPRLRREQDAAKTAARALKMLSRFAAANEPENFFAAVFHLLQEQIGARLDLPSSSITEAVVEENFRPRGVAAETMALTQELFQACNQARYAQQRTSAELASFIPKVERALEKLRKIE